MARIRTNAGESQIVQPEDVAGPEGAAKRCFMRGARGWLSGLLTEEVAVTRPELTPGVGEPAMERVSFTPAKRRLSCVKVQGAISLCVG